MLRSFAIATLLLFCTATAGFSLGVGEAAPAFSLTSSEGASLNLEDFKNKGPLMLVFWATWCPVCKEELPQIKKIVDEFGPRGLAVIGINVGVNDSPRKMVAYKKKYGLEYPVAFDQDSRVTKAFGVAGTPTILILDKKGIVRYRNAAVPDDLGQHFAKLTE